MEKTLTVPTELTQSPAGVKVACETTSPEGAG